MIKNGIQTLYSKDAIFYVHTNIKNIAHYSIHKYIASEIFYLIIHE